jgi:hypothetical protein
MDSGIWLLELPKSGIWLLKLPKVVYDLLNYRISQLVKVTMGSYCISEHMWGVTERVQITCKWVYIAMLE